MSPSEFEKGMSYLKSTQMPGGYYYAPPDSIKIPETIDWREYGAVSQVRNQKKCGACWAFAAVRKICYFEHDRKDRHLNV